MKEYIQENKERFFQELFSLLRIPSVSAKPEHKQDMYRCADRLVELLKEAGADEAAVEAGEISAERYASYLGMLEEDKKFR